MTLTHVLTPIKIGQVGIANRVARTAHETNLGHGIISDALAAYHEARAAGGVGLTILEIMSVHPSSMGPLNFFAPGMEDSYKRFVDRIGPYGMKLFQQLWHGGHNALPRDKSQPWSASDVTGSYLPIVPKPMTKAMIETLVERFADAAHRLEACGVDGVELHAAHGYLIAQFLRTSTNRREDDYGGTFENRARFLIEILQAIRANTTRKFAVGVRLGADGTPDGLTPEDIAALTRMLEARGLIDYVNVSLGNYESLSLMVGGMHEPAGYMMPTSVPVTRAATVPALVTGRIRTLEEADQIIRAGDADLVAMTRAHIADPAIVRKTLSGYPEQVRPCIGCNQGCLGGVAGTSGWGSRYRLGCAVNPGAGRESVAGDAVLTQATTPRNILVIGGGVSGMEAARVAAIRGHRVTLVEAQSRLGGTAYIASLAPKRGGFRDIVVWLEEEVFRLGVDVRLNTYFEAADVGQYSPDSLIVATGASPRMDGIQACNPSEPMQGFEQSHVISSNDLLTTLGRNWGKSAVVIDDLGHYEAVAAVEHLIELGTAVTMVTRFPNFAPSLEWIQTREPALERIARGNFRFMPYSRALSIADGTLVVAPVFKSDRVEAVPADTIVFVSANRPNLDILDGLSPTVAVKIVGDANGERFVQAAIAEGHAAGASA